MVQILFDYVISVLSYSIVAITFIRQLQNSGTVFKKLVAKSLEVKLKKKTSIQSKKIYVLRLKANEQRSNFHYLASFQRTNLSKSLVDDIWFKGIKKENNIENWQINFKGLWTLLNSLNIFWISWSFGLLANHLPQPLRQKICCLNSCSRMNLFNSD